MQDVGAAQRRPRRPLPDGDGPAAAPAIAVLDSQSVANASEGALGGYDAAKQVDGVKRHIMVDTNGFRLAAKVTQASVPEREGAHALFGHLAQKKRRPRG